ncbi:hypothetical protein P872_08515 [Rhodonellum psychrophilum GCM71 = DSM 17998]|uniref:Uncharacterized protein n=1 Tax=Rhodonellum psychrophilum GCM71 = DSM 17998 TaxID=1123057 RepID=U5C1P9_9BACT|nr:hypothetical protein P872_08515 [Rhodonellum psychrophilum GCM71 = DSM 17998]
MFDTIALSFKVKEMTFHSHLFGNKSLIASYNLNS